MRMISPNTEPATSVRLYIGFTGASIFRCFSCIYSSLLPLLGLARYVGFAKLKNLANQEIVSCHKKDAELGVPALIALCRALLKKSVRGELIVFDVFNLGGSIEPIYNAVNVVEFAVEKGA
jgi:hypothetical protein